MLEARRLCGVRSSVVFFLLVFLAERFEMSVEFARAGGCQTERGMFKEFPLTLVKFRAGCDRLCLLFGIAWAVVGWCVLLFVFLLREWRGKLRGVCPEIETG